MGCKTERKLRLTLIVTRSVVTDILQALGQRLDELLVKQTDIADRVIVAVKSNDVGVLSLTIFEEGITGGRVELL